MSYLIVLSDNGQTVGQFGPYEHLEDAKSDAVELSNEMQLTASVHRQNSNHDEWAQSAVKEMQEEGTVGLLTAKANRAGYRHALPFARKIMENWDKGIKSVPILNDEGEETYRRYNVDMKTMREATFAVNMNKRSRRRNPRRQRWGLSKRGNLYVARNAYNGAEVVGSAADFKNKSWAKRHGIPEYIMKQAGAKRVRRNPANPLHQLRVLKNEIRKVEDPHALGLLRKRIGALEKEAHLFR